MQQNSPTKNNNYYPKKNRKGTFSQASISPTEVGEFKGGYFVMPDPSATKENNPVSYPDPVKSKNNSPAPKLELRSPARRKQHANNDSSYIQRSSPSNFHSHSHSHSTPLPQTSPVKERSNKLEHQQQQYQDIKKSPFVEIKKKDSTQVETGSGLLPPRSFTSPYTTKSAPVSPVVPKTPQLQFYEPNKGQTMSMPVPIPPVKENSAHAHSPPSTSPPPSERWAGPAFGNAPHPSSLPLPEWTNTHHSELPRNHWELPRLSTSPPVQDIGNSLPHHHHHSEPPSPSSHSYSHSSNIPATVPFPYVTSSHLPPPVTSSPPPPAPSLAQLSTDLRRLLNISGGGGPPLPIVNSDPILVSANSG